MEKILIPRVLKGFRDIQPKDQKIRETCITKLQNVFSLFGFLPIDTPILEYEETLLHNSTKNSGEQNESDTEKQVYKFSDRGKRNVAMRFDLTVPFARFVAQHNNILTLPFNRYQIGKVFRGENTQRGRYREFIQCDFDIIGTDSVFADSTIVQLIDSALYTLLDSPKNNNPKQNPCSIHISHRTLLNELLQKEKCEEHLVVILRILDKMRKTSLDKIIEQLCLYINEKSAQTIIRFCSKEKSNEDTFEKIKQILNKKPADSPALLRLIEIERASTHNKLCTTIVVDPSIMRGLDYYTGFVCETFIHTFLEIGSICSGGRYNNLTQRFNKTPLPGVGASIGLDRLLSVLNTSTQQTLLPTHTIIYNHNSAYAKDAFYHQHILHQNNISAEIFPETTSLKPVFKYAERIQAAFLLILGEEEIQTNTITIKDLHTREQQKQILLHEAIKWILNKTQK